MHCGECRLAFMENELKKNQSGYKWTRLKVAAMVKVRNDRGFHQVGALRAGDCFGR